MINQWKCTAFREFPLPGSDVAYEATLTGPAGSVHVENKGGGRADVFYGPGRFALEEAIVVHDADLTIEDVLAGREFLERLFSAFESSR